MSRSRSGVRSPLERPWTRRALMQDLALGEVTQSKLAESYGCSEAAITLFKQRHLAEINLIRDHAEDEFAGILIAKKAGRLQAYQDMLERAEESGDDKHAAKVLRQVAEELGALPQRVAISGQLDTQSRYVIDGVDLEQLR